LNSLVGNSQRYGAPEGAFGYQRTFGTAERPGGQKKTRRERRASSGGNRQEQESPKLAQQYRPQKREDV